MFSFVIIPPLVIVYLNFSFNNQTLGAALLENKAMCTLNLANNGIDAVGAFTILVGARDNPNLHYLNLDGNPIGQKKMNCIN